MEWISTLATVLQPQVRQRHNWNFVLVEQLAQSVWPYATIHQVAENMAEGDPDRFTYLYLNFQTVLPRLLADEWVTQLGEMISLTFKGRVAASLPKDHS